MSSKRLARTFSELTAVATDDFNNDWKMSAMAERSTVPGRAKRAARSSSDERTPDHSGEDLRLVDTVKTVLVDDPDVHTDTRMRLSREIPELLRRAHEDVYGPVDGPARYEAVKRSVGGDDDQLPLMLAAVLADPDLHTDIRMRLYFEIPEMLREARERDAGRAK